MRSWAWSVWRPVVYRVSVMSGQAAKDSNSQGELRGRRATSTNTAPKDHTLQASASGSDEEDRVGVLDVVKAIAPLLIIVGIALSMLVLGYVFLPPNLSPSFLGQTISAQPPPSTVVPPVTKEEPTIATSNDDDDDGLVCSEILNVKELIAALKDFSQWRELGFELSVSAEQLDSIEADNQGDTEIKKRAMLRAWFSAQQEVCWHHVIDALLSLRQIELAKKIALKNGIMWVN